MVKKILAALGVEVLITIVLLQFPALVSKSGIFFTISNWILAFDNQRMALYLVITFIISYLLVTVLQHIFSKRKE